MKAVKAGLTVLSVTVFWQVLMVVHPRTVRSRSGSFGGIPRQLVRKNRNEPGAGGA